MGEFDPIRAAGEELAGLVEVHRVLVARSREAERRYAEAEADHNSLAKLESFTGDLVARQRVRLKQLQDEAEAKGKTDG